jgi:hypothetical protein
VDPKSLFSLSDHLDALSKEGDPLEVLQHTVDFEYFRAWFVEGLGYGDGAKRPAFRWQTRVDQHPFCIRQMTAPHRATSNHNPSCSGIPLVNTA